VEALEDRTVPSTVASAANGGTYAIWGGGRQLYWTDGTNWSQELGGASVKMVAAGANGYVDALATDGTLWQYTPQGGWGTGVYWFNNGSVNNVHAMAAGASGQIYLTYGSSNEVWEWYNGNWTDTHIHGVSDISVDIAANVYGVNANGALKEYQYVGGNQWNSGDATAKTIWGYGVNHVACGSGGEVYFTFGSSNALYGYNSSTGQWWDGPTGVSQISASLYGGGMDFVSGGGNLYHDGNYYQYIWGPASGGAAAATS
jgi:hypothetical protein